VQRGSFVGTNEEEKAAPLGMAVLGFILIAKIN
jgi:hypothetical protein